MKIGIDISAIVFGTGVSRYTQNLCQSLIEAYPTETFVLYGGSLRKKKILEAFAQNFSQNVMQKMNHLSPTIQSFLFNQLHLPIEPFTGKLDIFHSWDWYTPAIRHGSLVTTIHDLSAVLYEADTHPSIVAHHRRSLAWIKKEAVKIIAVSESTKRDIMRILSIPEKNIEVIYEALPREQQIKPSQEEIKETSAKYNIQRPYVVLVSSQEPRKNITRAINAFEAFSKTHDLVLIGNKGYDRIESKSFVKKVGYVDSHSLACLYRGSEALLYPSYYEGFGLPILEAFFHQTPVIVAKVSSMPEVAGQAASYCDPFKTSSIVQAIQHALTNRQSLINEGIKQLSKFNWQKTAAQTMAVYEAAITRKQ